MAERDENGKWIKGGGSPNPGGRPAILREVQELARSYTTTAITTLAKMCEDEKAPHMARVASSIALLDRGWGKPSQPIGGAEDLPPLQAARRLSDEELMRIALSAGDEPVDG